MPDQPQNKTAPIIVNNTKKRFSLMTAQIRRKAFTNPPLVVSFILPHPLLVFARFIIAFFLSLLKMRVFTFSVAYRRLFYLILLCTTNEE